MLSHLKRRIGVLSAIAVVAALVPAFVASPVSALPNSSLGATATAALDGHTYSACPTGSAAAAGFTDTTSTDVDCIAMYGITTGVTATTYEPSANIPRWQMALYLTRTMDIAGYTLGSGADQGFTDISGYSAAIQTAINQLGQSGVTTGTTATTYDPDSNVTREQMAMFVARMLGKVAAGPGGSADTSTSVNVNGGTTAYNYTDIDGGSVTFEGHNAIIELFHLGVPGHGSTVTTFGPATAITRGDMATWLTNGLDHTNARPAGLTMQSSTTSGYGALSPTLVVSHRTSDFKPSAGVVVDVFEWTNTTVEGNGQFSATTNLCGSTTAATGNSLTKCVIDVGDSVTNASGNLATITEAVAASTTNSYIAWTGATAEKYLNGTTSGAAVDVAAGAAMVNLVMTPTSNIYGEEMSNAGADGGTKDGSGFTPVKFGTDVTINMQLTTSLYAPTAIANTLITCTHSIATDSDAATLSTTTTYLYTDATGAASLTISQADPKPFTAVAADARNHVVTCLSAAGAAPYAGVNPAEVTSYTNGLLGATSSISASGVLKIRYTDVAAASQKTIITQNAKYGVIAALATSPVTRSATATVYDQYGNGIAGDTVLIGGSTVAVADTAVANTLNLGTAALFPVGTQVRFTNMSAEMAADFTEGTVYYVSTTANSAQIFSTVSSTGTVVTATAGETHTATAVLVTASDMSASRVSDSNGVVSVAWSDDDVQATGAGVNHTNTGPDVVIAVTGDSIAAGSEMGTSTYYRVLKPANVTAESTTLVPAALAAAAPAGDTATVIQTMLYDTTAQQIVVYVVYDSVDDADADAAAVYMVYTYDDNDQFTCAGTACTFATWQSALNGTSTSFPSWSADKAVNAKGLTTATYGDALVTSVHAFGWAT